MDTKSDTHCVAVFQRHQDADRAIRALQSAGFDMKKLSIAGCDYHTDDRAIAFYNAGDRVWYWGAHGAFWGGIFGILLAPAFFWIPGVGPILTGGLFSSMVMGAIEGGVVGASVVGGTSAVATALSCLGIPRNSVIRYETELRANKFLLIANGTGSQVARVRVLLAENRGESDVFPAPLPGTATR